MTFQNFENIDKEYGKLLKFINSNENEISKMTIKDYILYLNNPPYSNIKPLTYSDTSIWTLNKINNE